MIFNNNISFIVIIRNIYEILYKNKHILILRIKTYHLNNLLCIIEYL